MTVKFRWRSWLPKANDPSWQVALLPHISIYVNGSNLCIGGGWLFWCPELWIGTNLQDLE